MPSVWFLFVCLFVCFRCFVFFLVFFVCLFLVKPWMSLPIHEWVELPQADWQWGSTPNTVFGLLCKWLLHKVNSLQGLEPTNTSLWIFCLWNLLDPFLMLSEAGYCFHFEPSWRVFGAVQCQTLFVINSDYPVWSSQRSTACAPSAGASWVWKGWSCLLLLALGPRAGQARNT